MMLQNQDEQPLISVIVPVYNVAEYLPECVDSIINQTYKNLEIILVDDGSTDACPDICDEYAKRDSRIRVIHKKNGGLSDARNAGLDICTGEWIGFVDSDDTIKETMYEILYKDAIHYDADISMCRNNFIIDDREIEKNWDDGIKIIAGKEKIIDEIFCMRGISIAVWVKLYKNKCREIKFPVGKTTEDAFAFLNMIKEDDTLVIHNIGLYNYRLRGGSITNKKNYKRSILDCVEAYEYNYMVIKERYAVCIKAAERRLAWACAQSMYLILKTDNYKCHYSKVQYLRRKLRSNITNYFRNEKIDFFYRVMIVCAVISPKLYRCLRMFIEKLRNLGYV